MVQGKAPSHFGPLVAVAEFVATLDEILKRPFLRCTDAMHSDDPRRRLCRRLYLSRRKNPTGALTSPAGIGMDGGSKGQDQDQCNFYHHFPLTKSESSLHAM